jgi:hypothetical protein
MTQGELIGQIVWLWLMGGVLWWGWHYIKSHMR